MGRSVDYLNRAIGVAYINYEANSICCDYCGTTNISELDTDEKESCNESHTHLCKDCNKTFEGIEPDAESEWDYFTEVIEDVLRERLPSIDILKGRNCRWDGNETRIFAENRFAEFGISEYCGIVSISVRVIEDNYSWKYESLAKNWINKTWPGIQKQIAERFPSSALRKVGSFSNGEGVYELIK